ncbi:MAG TPA: hypothetical protein PKG80_03475 [Acidobacteriota bacterium]|nr:hypothetical protein [Acidobacteriota bacterium]
MAAAAFCGAGACPLDAAGRRGRRLGGAAPGARRRGRRAVAGAGSRPPSGTERGAVLVAVLVIALMAGAVAAGAVAAARGELVGGARRAASAQARLLARAVVEAAAQWFEAPERGAIVPPPGRAEVDRDGRWVRVGAVRRSWRGAPSPLDCRYKERAGAPLFRPPDGDDPADRFLGDPLHPDVLMTPDGPGRATLDALAAALAPRTPFRVVRLAFFEPQGGGAGALAALEAEVEVAGPGGRVARAAARADIVAVPWGRTDRPLLVEGAARFVGEAGWRFGEAVFGGDLDAAPATAAAWAGGVPWLAADRPVREDNDGDGAADDADADGAPDWAAWRDAPGTLQDPWWRGRVGGLFNGSAAGACLPVRPFPPRAAPPAAPTTRVDRSGLVAACPEASPPAALPGELLEVAASGRRGARTLVEDPERAGAFRLDGGGASRPLEEWLPRAGGVCAVLPCAGRATPLPLRLSGAGALLIEGDVALAAGDAAAEPLAPPPDLRDTRGADRAPTLADDVFVASPDGGCDAWRIGGWGPPAPGVVPAAPAACGAADVHWRGLVAVAGRVALAGPATIVGQLRARTLEIDGGAGPAVVWAAPAPPAGRDGPPGAPRVVLRGLRSVP